MYRVGESTLPLSLILTRRIDMKSSNSSPKRLSAMLVTLGLLALSSSCTSTKAIINRAQGGPIEKHGQAGTVPSEPSVWHYGLVPFGLGIDLLMSPFRVAEWFSE